MNVAVVCGLIILAPSAAIFLARALIAVALVMSSTCAILPVLDTGATVFTSVRRISSGISVFSPLAIPFLILAGNVMDKGDIAVRLINLTEPFMGGIPGALAYTNAVASVLFGTVSGSDTAAVPAVEPIIRPIEEEEGYDRDFSVAANIATAPTGLLTPPSNVTIIYFLVSGGASVVTLFIAGYIPGILWGLTCMAVIFCSTKKEGYRNTKKYSNNGKVKVFFQVIPRLLMIVIVIRGIVSGIFTATEGSAVTVMYSLIFPLFFCESIKFPELPRILLDSAEVIDIIIFLIGVSSIMGWVMAFARVPTAVSETILRISDDQYVILFTVNILLLIIGTFMDMTPACLILTPVFLPICQTLGVSTVCSDIMMIFNLCTDTIMPPVRTTPFMDVKMDKAEIENIIEPLLLCFAAIFVMLLLVSYVPTLSIWLPGLLGYV